MATWSRSTTTWAWRNAVGTTVIVHGQFEPDPGHPVIHYTHHATGRHPGGWIEVNGQTYQ